jgi:demethylmenaquinone methyltransferase/2-methoxy-6-polyprenyl-1,4-benzoquinol methylase
VLAGAPAARSERSLSVRGPATRRIRDTSVNTTNLTSSPASPAGKTPQIDKSSDRVRDMFAQIAGKYDLLNHLLSLNIDRHWRRAVVRHVPPEGSAPILDLCTGTGDLAFEYAKSHRGSAPIVGADFCHEMLQIAQRKQARQQTTGISFLAANAMDLPLKSDHFQIVSVAFGLRNIEETDRGLREIIRVCQPGGRVAILEFSSPRRQPLKAIYGFYFQKVLPRIGQWIARNDKDAYEYLPSSVGRFPCGEELAERMQAAGLRQVEFKPLTFGIVTLYTGVK